MLNAPKRNNQNFIYELTHTYLPNFTSWMAGGGLKKRKTLMWMRRHFFCYNIHWYSFFYQRFFSNFGTSPGWPKKQNSAEKMIQWHWVGKFKEIYLTPVDLQRQAHNRVVWKLLHMFFSTNHSFSLSFTKIIYERSFYLLYAILV